MTNISLLEELSLNVELVSSGLAFSMPVLPNVSFESVFEKLEAESEYPFFVAFFCEVFG